MAAGGVSRTRQLNRRHRNRSAATERTNQSAGCADAGVRSNQEFGLRTGDGCPDWPRQLAWATNSDRSGSGSHFWFCFDERLECARHSGLGVSTAWSVSRQKLFHQYFAVGRDHGSARAVSETAAETRSRTVALSPGEE